MSYEIWYEDMGTHEHHRSVVNSDVPVYDLAGVAAVAWQQEMLAYDESLPWRYYVKEIEDAN